jgi:hypothetical protein
MASFVEFATTHGLLIDEPFTDGRIHCVPTDDDKSGKRSGAYVCHGKSLSLRPQGALKGTRLILLESRLEHLSSHLEGGEG